jgi:hypothetical protein
LFFSFVAAIFLTVDRFPLGTMTIKTSISTALLCVAVTFAAFPTAHAQLTEKEKQEKEAERKQQIEKKAYGLVEEIAAGALAVKLPENRIYLLSASADLLWEHDQPRARSLFWDAANTLMLLVPPARADANDKSAKASPQNKEADQTIYYTVFALRQELLTRVARRDPQFALDLLRSSRPLLINPANESAGGFPFPQERDLEQQIAAEGAARDPQKALQIARESLAKGLSFRVLELLAKLNQQDGEIASKFAGDIIEKLRARNLVTDPYAGSIAVSLLNLSREPAAPEKTGSGWRHLKLDKEQKHDLVDIITTAALAGSAKAGVLYELDEVMPEIQEFAPERIALLQRKLASFNQTLNKEQRLSQEYNSLMRNGTPEEILKLANTAGDDERQSMQQQAVVVAVMRRRTDALREFINREVEESKRKSLLDALDAEEIDGAAYRGDAEALQKLLPKIGRREERARAMTAVALALEKTGDHDEAVRLLDEAQTMIRTDFASDTQTNALLSLVVAYALIEPAKAFVIVERTIDRANENIAKLILLDKLLKSGVIKKGEIKMQNSGLMPVEFAVFRYGKGVAALANADFDRTRAAADRFERNELRLMFRLLVAQALLQKPQEN